MALGGMAFSQAQTSTVRDDRPVTTLAFDWIYTALLLLLSAGIYLDGWSHLTYGPDQSVFSEYHLLFYTSLVLIAFWVLGNTYRYLGQGYSRFRAIPRGYTLTFIGVFVFGLGGVLDLTGHALFGFEADLEALLSPTHMVLFIGWALLSLGPAKAAAQRFASPTLLELLPGLISWTLFANVLAFAGLAYFPTVNNPWMLAEWRSSTEFFAQILGVLGILAQSVLLVGVLLWLLYTFRLPRGALTLFMTLFALLTTISSLIPAFIPVFIVSGLLLDGLYALLRPSAARRAQLYTFGFLTPVLFWSLVYAFSFATNLKGGVWYTGYLWTGSILEAGLVGLLVTLLSTSGALSRTKA